MKKDRSLPRPQRVVVFRARWNHRTHKVIGKINVNNFVVSKWANEYPDLKGKKTACGINVNDDDWMVARQSERNVTCRSCRSQSY